MENFRAIEYHQMRDFSKKMNVTFEFIRQNFKSLGKSILFIAGPPVMVASLIIATFFSEFLDLTQAAAANAGNAEFIETYFMSINFWIQIVLMFCFFLISAVMSIATINNYLLLYEEKQTNEIPVSLVWDRVRATFWMYFGTTFFFWLMAIGVYIILIIPVVLLAAISPGLIVLGMMVLFCGIFYLAFSASLTFFVRAYEKKNFFDAIERSFRLVYGKWWSTFGLIFLLYLVMVMISYIFIIPWYAVTLTSALHSTSTGTMEAPTTTWQIMTIVFFTLYYLAQMILAALPNIGIAFQYFNLVELKEAKGLLGKIDSLGQTSASLPSSEEQY